jgi:hypothetical protein
MATPEICRIKIYFDLIKLSPNRLLGLHWSKARRGLKAKVKDAALWSWYQAGRPRSTVPVSVFVISRRARRLDDDNLFSMLKWFRDALFKKAITPDDSPKWFEYIGRPRQEVGKQYKLKPEIEFIVFARDQLPLDLRRKEKQEWLLLVEGPQSPTESRASK